MIVLLKSLQSIIYIYTIITLLSKSENPLDNGYRNPRLTQIFYFTEQTNKITQLL